MTEHAQETSTGSPRQFETRESALFPDGMSATEDDFSEAAADYLLFYPGYAVEPNWHEIQSAKLGSVASVWVDATEGVTTRRDLAQAISKANYPVGHPLAVTNGIRNRTLGLGKSIALSEASVYKFARSHAQEPGRHHGYDGQITGHLGNFYHDLSRLVATLRHAETANMTMDLEEGLMDFAETTPHIKRLGEHLINKAIRHEYITDKNYDLNKLDVVVTNLVGIINDLARRNSLSDRELDMVAHLGGIATDILRDRGRNIIASMADSQGSLMQFVGTNADKIGALTVRKPIREIVTMARLTDEEVSVLRQKAKDHQDQQRQVALALKAQREQGIAEHIAKVDAKNAEIIARMEALADQYNELTGQMYVTERKTLRNKCIFGQDSVVRRMLDSFEADSKDTIENAAQLYLGLALKAKDITSSVDLIEYSIRAAEIKAQYEAAKSEILAGGSPYEIPALKHDLSSDLAWLDTNFDEMYVDCISKCRQHVALTGEPKISRVIELLRRGGQTNSETVETE